MSNPVMPDQDTMLHASETSGSPAYVEMQRIWRGALNLRRQKKADGSRANSEQEIKDWIGAQLGSGSTIQPDLPSVSREMAAQANPEPDLNQPPDPQSGVRPGIPNTGGAPLSGAEHTAVRVGELANGALLNVPRMVSTAVDQTLSQGESQDPNVRNFGTAGAALPFGAIAKAPVGLFGRAGLSAVAGGMLAMPAKNQPADWSTVAKSALLSGALAGLSEAAVMKYQLLYAPAAHAAEEIDSRMGTHGRAAAAAKQALTPDVPLTLADVSPTARGEIFKVSPRFSPEARAPLTEETTRLIQVAQDGVDRLSKQYNQVLGVTLDNPTVREIVGRPRVQAILKDLHKEGGLVSNDFTARNLQDVRIALSREARDLGKKLTRSADLGDRIRYNALRTAERDLRDQLVTIPGFATVEGKYGPYAQLLQDRKDFLKDLQRRQRAMAIAQPKGIKGALSHEAGQEAQQVMNRRSIAIAQHGLQLPWQHALDALHGSGFFRTARQMPFGLMGEPIARPDTGQ